jgi:hypothetical protein
LPRTAAGYRGLKMDITEPMLGLTFAMPGLCLLALAGLAVAGLRKSDLRRPVTLLWLAAAPFSLALLTAVATAERYTADFCPFLITAGAFGLSALEGRRGQATLRVLLTLLTLWSVWAMLAITLHFEGVEVWGASEQAKENYRILSHRVEQLFHLPPHDAP